MFCSVYTVDMHYIASYQRFASKIHQFYVKLVIKMLFSTIFNCFQPYQRNISSKWFRLVAVAVAVVSQKEKNWTRPDRTGPDLKTLFQIHLVQDQFKLVFGGF